MDTREQELVDLCFQLGLAIHESRKLKRMTREKLVEWIAERLRQCGFDTKPCGASWGVLQKEKAR